MIVRGLDENHDWTFGRGRNNYKSGKLAQAQVIKTNLLMFINDCFFALQLGIDWFNLLGNKNIVGVNMAQRASLLRTPEVLSIESAESSFDSITRELSSVYRVNTLSGEISATGNEIGNLLNRILTEDGDAITTEDGDGIRTE